jgi:hypothetical protein
MIRKLTAAIAFIVLPLVLGGCIVGVGPVTTTQDDVIGNVRLTFAICPSETEEDPAAGDQDPDSHDGCPNNGNAGPPFMSPDPTNDNDYQVLVAFRVPVGTTAPAAFAAGPGSTGLSDTLSFTRSPSYARSLTDGVPPPAGFEWVGYISNSYTHNDGADNTPAQRAQFSVEFGLPPAVAGTPFAGPFRIRPVVGGRIENGEPTRTVSCGDDPFDLSGGSVGGSSICIDSPGQPITTNTNIQVATRDLAIAPSTVTASPGQTPAVPFDANLNGTLPAGTTFSVSATTNLPGVTVAPSPASFAPAANATTRITVPVPIPKAAGPGTYDVALTARLPNGQTRAGVSKLTVRDRQKPVASRLSIRPKTLRPQAPSVAAAARASYRLSEAATMSFRVQRCRKVKRRTRCKTLKGSFKHAGNAGTNRFRFTGFLRNRALKRGSYRLVGTPTDLAKNKGKSVRASFRIKR